MTTPFIERAIELSTSFRDDPTHSPFGAVIVQDGVIIAEGVNSTITFNDPTAHAEVLAIRAAAQALHSPTLPNATLYVSSHPCPLCLMACYCAQIKTIYYAAELTDSSYVGFPDLRLYRQLLLPTGDKGVKVARARGIDRLAAIRVLNEWEESQKTLGKHGNLTTS